MFLYRVCHIDGQRELTMKPQITMAMKNRHGECGVDCVMEEKSKEERAFSASSDLEKVCLCLSRITLSI